MVVEDAWLTVSTFEPLLALNELSPAKDACTPAAYVLVLMPVRLALASDATPEPLVTADPTELPFNLNPTVFPPTPELLTVSVAERFTVPPYVPVAEATLSEVVCTVAYVAV